MNQFNSVLFSLDNSVGKIRKSKEDEEAKRFQASFTEFLDLALKSFSEKTLKKSDLTSDLEEDLFQLLLSSYNFGGSSALQSLGLNTKFSTIKRTFDLTDKDRKSVV